MRILSYKSVNVKLLLEGLLAKKAKILGCRGGRPIAHGVFAAGDDRKRPHLHVARASMARRSHHPRPAHERCWSLAAKIASLAQAAGQVRAVVTVGRILRFYGKSPA
jgi:hypothetical protein